MTSISRRSLLTAAAAISVGANAAGQSIGLCTGTYGMKSLSNRAALELIADIGYDGVEISLLPGWPADPLALEKPARMEVRRVLEARRLALPSLLESIPLTPGRHAANLERLRRAAEMAHDLAPAKPPIVETVLGLIEADWESSKTRMAEELAGWAKVARETGIAVAIKAHADQAVNSPDRAEWLLKQVDSSSLRLIYDYSHMYIEGFDLEASLRQLFPYTVFIAVKDGRKTAAGHDFLLPGDGNTNYRAYFALLKQLNYRGYLGVEVSALIFRQPGYDP
ncbi:MAG: sugar phosphate isomerase/epimerase, partial [Bryobacteraceae bacterium]